VGKLTFNFAGSSRSPPVSKLWKQSEKRECQFSWLSCSWAATRVIRHGQLPGLLALSAPASKASGTLESHYAPQARVQLMNAKALSAALDLWVSAEDAVSPPAAVSDAGPVIAVWSRGYPKTRSARLLCRHMPADAATAAQQLFAVLREFDAQGVQLIWIESPPDAPEWDGVRDRLVRASAY
jgi:L-threonylcarbamoyladenylate synthase